MRGYLHAVLVVWRVIVDIDDATAPHQQVRPGALHLTCCGCRHGYADGGASKRRMLRCESNVVRSLLHMTEVQKLPRPLHRHALGQQTLVSAGDIEVDQSATRELIDAREDTRHAAPAVGESVA
ncbi:hypothetical protein IA64_08985 [Xanthomonas arboricola pv. celebensis]|nr:hypothetical protein IA64_08985 [Xanthomonas arboricola pv. celebensis]